MRHRLMLVFVAVLLALTGSGCSLLPTVKGTALPSPTPLPTLDDYMNQRVSWKRCPDERDAQCGEIKIPVDYKDPGNLAIVMPLVMLPATDPAQRLGVLTMNPGGPGESGYQQILSALDTEDTGFRKFRLRYDLVGFDPRGVGRTAGITCLDDREMDEYLATDFTPTDDAGLRKVADAHKRYSAACLRNTGKLLGFVGTEHVARDMDIMRSALGEEKLNFFGFSYGTRIGQYYAEQFPKRVGRMVLDSVDDPGLRPARWEFGDEDDYERDPARPVELSPRDQLVHDILVDCAKRADCRVGHDAEAAMGKLYELIDKVDKTPIPVDDGRLLGSNLAILGIFQATYDERYWDKFIDGFADALAGDGTGLAKLADHYVDRNEDGKYSTSDPAFWSVQCANDDPKLYRSKNEEQILAELSREAKYRAASSPVFGANRVFSSPLCLFWPVPPTEESKSVDAAGAPTIVLINNTGDLATPLEEAQDVADSLDDAVLVINEHDGHIAFDNGSECVDGIVLGYFFDGEVPADGTRCTS